MIYVLTVHHQSDAWIEPQLDYLHRHLARPFKVFANLEGVDERWHGRFDRVVPALGQHAHKLNLLAAEASADGEPSDLLMFLDGDAFPVADPMPIIDDAMATTGFLAIKRIENIGDAQPHPSFAVTTIATWRRIHGDWSPGHTWMSNLGTRQTDVGGNLIRLFELAGQSWTPLYRSNKGRHPLWFGVYGGVIYHHGAGFRARASRADSIGKRMKFKRVPLVRSVEFRLRAALHRRRVGDVNADSCRIYSQLRSDPDFWRSLE